MKNYLILTVLLFTSCLSKQNTSETFEKMNLIKTGRGSIFAYSFFHYKDVEKPFYCLFIECVGAKVIHLEKNEYFLKANTEIIPLQNKTSLKLGLGLSTYLTIKESSLPENEDINFYIRDIVDFKMKLNPYQSDGTIDDSSTDDGPITISPTLESINKKKQSNQKTD